MTLVWSNGITVVHLALHVVLPFDVDRLHLELLDKEYKIHRHHHKIFVVFSILPLHLCFYLFVLHDSQCYSNDWFFLIVFKLDWKISTEMTKHIRIYPLLSISSIGSSKICVTFGNVSSALSTGNVFDRKSSVRFRISSLKADSIYNKYI